MMHSCIPQKKVLRNQPDGDHTVSFLPRGLMVETVFCQSQPWIRERTGHQFRAVGGLNQENPMIVQ